jgi:hypothetical protein
MDKHTVTLWNLADELFNVQEQAQLRTMAMAEVPNLDALTAFDDNLGGPSMKRLTCNHTDRYAREDRYIFRSLQYCAMDMTRVNGADWQNDAKWFARDLMENSSKHIEALLKDIGSISYLPFGTAIRNVVVKRKINSTAWGQVKAFLDICNNVKGQFSRDKFHAVFSVEDALLVYFICRRIGMKLYPLAKLATDITIFETECQ